MSHIDLTVWPKNISNASHWDRLLSCAEGPKVSRVPHPFCFVTWMLPSPVCCFHLANGPIRKVGVRGASRVMG